MSATTTQILFNSPALHSLKRDQLLKLCKLHSIKANGKNIELIEKLKQHALTLPKDDPLSLAARSDDAPSTALAGEVDKKNGDSDWGRQMPRPSEQWEIVMESIVEESSSQDTLSSIKTGKAGEFGSNGSKSNSVSSSIRALATSLGIKKSAPIKQNLAPTTSWSTHPSTDAEELAHIAVPYSSLPTPDPESLPQTDHFTFSRPDGATFPHASAEDDPVLSAPIPGQADLRGIPAPANARLSIGVDPAATTIRLVSAPFITKEPETPRLRPFETTFDLVAGTPGVAKINVWPASPTPANGGEQLYPTITPPSPPLSIQKSATSNDNDDDVDMPGGISAARSGTNRLEKSIEADKRSSSDTMQIDPTSVTAPNSRPSLSPLPPQPFIFGSPLPEHNVSNKAFRDATTSVMEEMNKRLAGAGIATLNTGILEQKPSDGSNAFAGLVQRKPVATDRFAKVHEQAFKHMDSIANHYAAKRPLPDKKRKASTLGVAQGPAPLAKRRSSAANSRVISNGVRKKMVPGSFGDEEDDNDDDDNRRLSKRPRVNEADEKEGTAAGKVAKVSIAPESVQPETGTGDNEEKKKQKEREAIRRKLDKAKAKRRSSMGRPSLAGGRASILASQQAKGTKSRFGFLSSAKSIVQSVWNRGAGTKTAASSNIPVAKPVAKASVGRSIKVTSDAEDQKPVTRITATSTASRSLKPSGSSRPHPDEQKPSTNARARSPMPSFSKGSAATSRSGTSAGSNGSCSSRMVSDSTRSNTKLSAAGVSSVGTKASRISRGTASSLGTRASLASKHNTAIPSIGNKSNRPAVRSRTSSTLMAPTASSLAKTHMRLSPTVNQENQKFKRVGASAGTQGDVKDEVAGLSSSWPHGPVLEEPQEASEAELEAGTSSSATAREQSPASAAATSKPPLPPKPRLMPARKPRISRSKVIAKLASQRSASNSSAASSKPVNSFRTRSSMGAVVRQSSGNVKLTRRSGAGGDLLHSARKRARQSEYARRRSKLASPKVQTTESSLQQTMDVV